MRGRPEREPTVKQSVFTWDQRGAIAVAQIDTCVTELEYNLGQRPHTRQGVLSL